MNDISSLYPSKVYKHDIEHNHYLLRVTENARIYLAHPIRARNARTPFVRISKYHPVIAKVYPDALHHKPIELYMVKDGDGYICLGDMPLRNKDGSLSEYAKSRLQHMIPLSMVVVRIKEGD